MVLLSIAGWICLFALCESKYIEVNNEGNVNSSCCIEGMCLCGSLFEAFRHIENNTMINITSSVSLNDVTHIGLEALNNITITGNKVTVECNNTGVFSCRYCSNVVIQGITWDQCGDPTHPIFIHAIGFRVAMNVSIIGCTFQHSKVCHTVLLPLSSGFVEVRNSRFLFNHVTDLSHCDGELYSSLAIVDGEHDVLQNLNVSISGTSFYQNGVVGYTKQSSRISAGATLFGLLTTQNIVKFHIKDSTISTSYGLGGNFIFSNISKVTIHFTNMTYYNNSKGGSAVSITGNSSESFFLADSCSYAHNINGSLKLSLRVYNSHITLYELRFVGNIGTFMDNDPLASSNSIGQGSGILILSFCLNSSIIKISLCNVKDNIGSKSIVYVENKPLITQMTSIASSHFSSNIGSALHISGSTVQFNGHVLFMNNSAERGAAIYLDQGSQIVIKENSSIKFIGNTASQQGGAIFIKLSFGCPHRGIVFTELVNGSTVSFINNSAESAGNSVYFDNPELCDGINDILIYEFNYSQPPGLFGPPISTSPHKTSVCSTMCNENGSICHIQNRNMLGESVGIKAIVCDYYGNVSETVQFYVECTNCINKFKLSNDEILIYNGSFHVTFLSVDADSDIVESTNVTLSLFSVLSNEYRQLTATVSIELSSCQSGYVFDPNLQQCVCYEQSKDIIRCQQDYAEIKYGYWFGVAIPPKRTVSICPIHYCEYDTHAETSDGYYKLPKELNNQCSLHRTGVACGECKSGYTLAYDSPDCINVNKCSTGITFLVVTLTILYWIIVVALVFALMQCKIPLGYTYGLIYYYSIIGIVLGNNLFISDGVFQLVAIFSSFSNLTPQFLGKICFVEGLSGIDQQFIHYFHAISIFCLIGVVVVAARYSFKIASIVSRCIIRVICLLILLSYTSLASTSLQLLRPLYFDDVNGAYVYSSPSIEYFTGRHIPYGIIALMCGLFIVIGLPLLLLLEPFLKRKVNFIKIKPLLDQYQECYKDQYHWFAAYYLVCRLVIIAIVYVNNNLNNGLYYLQTACIITVTIHVWIKPYESEMLNVIDGITLLTIVLVINLNSFTFSRPLTMGLVIVFTIFPLLLSCAFYGRKIFSCIKCSWSRKKITANQEAIPKYVWNYVNG